MNSRKKGCQLVELAQELGLALGNLSLTFLPPQGGRLALSCTTRKGRFLFLNESLRAILIHTEPALQVHLNQGTGRAVSEHGRSGSLPV